MRNLANECRGPLYSYLGHFAHHDNLSQGHNDSGAFSTATLSGDPNAIGGGNPTSDALMEEIGGLD